MSSGLAQSGVERWVADTNALTMTHCARDGVILLVDHVTGVPDGLAAAGMSGGIGHDRRGSAIGP